MSRSVSKGISVPALVPSKLLTPEFVAEILGVTTHTLAVWRCAKRYSLAYVKIGGRVRYRPSDVDAFIAEQTREVAGPPRCRCAMDETPLFERSLREADRQQLKRLMARRGLSLDFDASDSSIRHLATAVAQFCDDTGAGSTSIAESWLRVKAIAGHLDVKPPRLSRTVSIGGALRRMADPTWWRRQLRAAVARRVDGKAIREGLIRRGGQLYCSDSGLARQLAARQRNQQLLAEATAVNEDGEYFTLDQLAGKTTSCPRLRRNELMARLRGLEELAAGRSDVGIFCTWTSPSRFHAVASRSGARNPTFDGSLPSASSAYLAKQWSRVRTRLDYLGINPYGLRVAEPHADATPHWHLLLFVSESQVEALQSVLSHYALAESPDEPGARQHRIRFERIDPEKGSAVGYLAKYISKNIDGHALNEAKVVEQHGLETVDDTSPSDTALRIRCWASIWGIRQFQFIGTPPVALWRELRRVHDEECAVEAIEQARKPADDGDYAKHVAAAGGVLSRRAELPLTVFLDDSVIALNRYGEAGARRPKGVATRDGLGRLITRVHTWTLVLPSHRAARPLDLCQ